MSFALNPGNKVPDERATADPESFISGQWVRIGQSGPIQLNFKSDGTVDVDFGNDGNIEVVSEFVLNNDTITFRDKEGLACKDIGKYVIYESEYYISLDLINDDCGGRLQATMGFWVRPNFNDLISELNQKILNTPEPEYFLSRGRIFMATGKPKEAQMDLDVYIKNDSTHARAFINRAGTRFPDDLEGALMDCNKAIELEPDNKNAYFLRGLALYGLGEKERACNDFSKAIELGFSILREAEYQRCSEYWE